jgi:hypothetical protein
MVAERPGFPSSAKALTTSAGEQERERRDELVPQDDARHGVPGDMGPTWMDMAASG